MPAFADLSKHERLKSLTLPMRPTRAPFYVQHPTTETPMIGWWWQPGEQLEPISSNYEMAVVVVSARVQAFRSPA
jgi:hypothetical protein